MITDKFFNIFIPHDIAADEFACSSAKILICSVLISLIASPAYALFYYYLNYPLGCMMILVAEGGMLSSLGILKYFHSLKNANTVFIASLTILLYWLSYHIGGIHAPTAYWLVLPALIAAFISGIKQGLIWCLINIIGILYFYYLDYVHFALPSAPISNPALLLTVAMCGLALIVVLFASIYASEKIFSVNKLRTLAYHDGLTILPNRLSYEMILEQAIYKAHANSTSFAVLLIDIDNFKRVNDVFGETFGNLLLKEIVNRIKNNILHTELMARIGGDQFKIIIEDHTDTESIDSIAKILLTALKIPYYINKVEINISASIGIVIYKKNQLQREYIDRYVDLALLKAKKNGGDNYQYYTASLADEEASLVTIERNLPTAIVNNQLSLYFQPQYDARNPTKITCVESLLRWHTDTLGEIPSSVFIPVAEKIGLITQLGEWVLRQSCRKYMEWYQSNNFDKNILLAINISPIQLYSKDFISTVNQVILETGIPPDRLEFELTETAIITDEENAIVILHNLRELGIRTVIDDFGSGYTSLSYLTLLPVTGLKIDKSFLDNMLKANTSAIIIESVIELAHKINLKVVVEGVENIEQLEYLHEIGCDHVQGYYLSMPLDNEAMQDLLQLNNTSTHPHHY